MNRFQVCLDLKEDRLPGDQYSVKSGQNIEEWRITRLP